MNALRRQLESERGVFVDRTYFDRLHSLLELRVRDLELSERSTAGKSTGQGATWALVISIALLALAAAGLWLKK